MTAFANTLDDYRHLGSIELKLRDIAQLFNSLDPSPFHEKDLDDDAEEFIVSWARELPPRTNLRLVLHLGTPLPAHQTARSIRESVQHYFAYRASVNRAGLRQFLRHGRTSLFIGIAFLAGCLGLGELIAKNQPAAFWDIARESLTIAGWVAMWRPMEIYLYEWWPIKAQGALLAKLSRMEIEVRVEGALAVSPV